MLGLSVAALGLSPAEFWNSTYYEITVSLEIWREINGHNKDQASAPMTRGRLAELMARYPDRKAS